MSTRGNVWLLESGAGFDRTMASGIQPGAATQLVGLSTASTGTDRVAPRGHWKRNARYERIPNIMGGTFTGGGSSYVSRMELQ